MENTKEQPSLSYIITTKNKLPYLKSAIERLVSHKEVDEEIIVSDGASSDGTKEYLESLEASGIIDYYVSEPDAGESHGLNKLILRARGTLVKPITDDDVYHHPSIQKCKEFMLSHPKIDMVSTEGGSLNSPARINTENDPLTVVRALECKEDYRKWKKDHTPFSFCGLGVIIRRNSLPILGLWDSNFRRADAEYALRNTSGKANIAWYTGYSFVNVSNPQSVSITFQKKIRKETDRLYKFYFDKNPQSFVVRKLNALIVRLKTGRRRRSANEFLTQWPQIVAAAEKWLEIKNEKNGKFLYKE